MREFDELSRLRHHDLGIPSQAGRETVRTKLVNSFLPENE